MLGHTCIPWLWATVFKALSTAIESSKEHSVTSAGHVFWNNSEDSSTSRATNENHGYLPDDMGMSVMHVRSSVFQEKKPPFSTDRISCLEILVNFCFIQLRENLIPLKLGTWWPLTWLWFQFCWKQFCKCCQSRRECSCWYSTCWAWSKFLSTIQSKVLRSKGHIWKISRKFSKKIHLEKKDFILRVW